MGAVAVAAADRQVAVPVPAGLRSVGTGGPTTGRPTWGQAAPSTVAEADAGATGEVHAALADLATALDRLGAAPLEPLGAEELAGLLEQVQRELGRLTAIRATATSRWHLHAEAAAGRGREQHAERETRQLLRDRLQLPPGEAKRAVRAGQQTREPGVVADGFRAGRLSEAHLAVIADVVRGVAPEVRARLEEELTTAAERLDPVALGRLARRRLAELDHEVARRDERRRHARRRLSMTTTSDGGVRISGQLDGLQAEKALTAFHAFHSQDPPGQRQSAEHRGADAFEALCDAALRSGEAGTQHGQRPHVQVLLPWETLQRGYGVAELGFTGPVTFDELRPLLSDVVAGRVLLDADGTPIEVSRQVRTVPAGLWRALVARDGRCTWSGCDAPPAWCQVAHGQVPYRLQGRLRLDNAALLCSRHHRRFDDGGWTMVIDGGSVTYHRSSGPGEITRIGAGVSGEPAGNDTCEVAGADGGEVAGAGAGVGGEPAGGGAGVGNGASPTDGLDDAIQLGFDESPG